ncbi:MAG: hypothetical protein GW859_06715 [Sphingomonadales bacterium]|nr:hypothetical protein [Sphingomonadales bacterium]
MIPTIFALALQSVTPGVYTPAPIELPPRDRAADARAKAVAEFDACIDRAGADAADGERAALDWLSRGGGWAARQCLGFAYGQAGNYAAAADAFSRAADDAAKDRADSAAALWVQAGNAALAAGAAPRAARYFDAALAHGSLSGLPLGEAHLDRARARAANGDMAGAGEDLARARIEAAGDPLVWLLSATLARRQGDLAAAASYIAETARLSPTDPATLLEAGNIAILSGQDETARRNWEAVVAAAPDSAEAASARENLGRLGAVAADPAPGDQSR